jgi:hypothetical protein
MLKNFLLSAVLVLASSPAFVSAQDIFFSFDEFSRVTSTTVGAGTATGSLFIFADENYTFTSADIDFTNSDASVVAFTGGTGFDSSGKFLAPPSITSPNGGSSSSPTPTDGRLLATSGITVGVRPSNTATDPDFRPTANATLLAKVDFDTIGPGTANFDFILGGLGIVDIFSQPSAVPVTFGSAELTVVAAAVPEPSSVALLILGATGMLTRRRRSN